MRVEEGKALEKDLVQRMELIDSTVAAIEKLSPEVAKKQVEAMRKRVAQLAGDVPVSEDRIAAEIVMLADKTDFTEEITRLRSHEAQFNSAIKRWRRSLQEAHLYPAGDAPRGVDHRREGIGIGESSSTSWCSRKKPRSCANRFRTWSDRRGAKLARLSHRDLGPVGRGQDDPGERLLAADRLISRSISTTTREPRAGEVEGRDYFFVDRSRFEALKEGGLIEWAEVHGALYGTRRDFVQAQLAAGWDVLLNIDIQGGDRVKRMFPGAVMVFILPPSLPTWKAAARTRATWRQSDFQIRLAAARAEIGASARYDYLVVNDELERAGKDLTAIITAERCRRERAEPDFGRAALID